MIWISLCLGIPTYPAFIESNILIHNNFKTNQIWWIDGAYTIIGGLSYFLGAYLCKYSGIFFPYLLALMMYFINAIVSSFIISEKITKDDSTLVCLPYFIAGFSFRFIIAPSILICDKVFRSPGLLVYAVGMSLQQIVNVCSQIFFLKFSEFLRGKFYGGNSFLLLVYFLPLLCIYSVVKIQREIFMYD